MEKKVLLVQVKEEGELQWGAFESGGWKAGTRMVPFPVSAAQGLSHRLSINICQ